MEDLAMKRLVLLGLVAILLTASRAAADPPHPLKTWVKRHPTPKPSQPPPRMGYETSYGYDPARKLLVRYAGHNQGGGGEQNSEVWTYDLARDRWTLKEPNDAPPGVCCAQQNVFDDAMGKFIRFPSFSGSHGWQSRREIDLKNSSVWTYDVGTNTWRAMRPCPEVWPAGLRGAAYDPHHQVTVIHAGEGARYGAAAYDLYANAWCELNPAGGPDPNVSQPGFTYDAVHRCFVLFGSQFHKDPRTWVYDLRANQWRALEVKEHPPADQSCPVLAADTRNGIVLCSVQSPSADPHGPSPLETWVLDVSKPQWTRLNVPREPDQSGARNRVLLYLSDENLFVLENRTREEQQIWTFRFAEAPAPPRPPRNLRVVTEASGATVSWEPAEGSKASRYTVLRGRGTKPWEVRLEPVAQSVEGTSYRDRALDPGVVYFYQVRPSGAEDKGAAAWPLARTQPPVVTGLVASVTGPRRVELRWEKSPAEDVVGYYVDRAEVAVYSSAQVRMIHDRYRPVPERGVGRIKRIGPFQRLTREAIPATRLADDSLDLASGPVEPPEPGLIDRPLHKEQFNAEGKQYPLAVYAYRVVAVNRLGVASGPSPLVFTYPSAPQHVFAKEEGKEQTRLRWKANPEKGLAGYLVYRYDGRWDKDTVTRLTPKPIAATEFCDETSGRGTRRYEIVAVDPLGQEGEPSQPIWSRREWAPYYVPYTGPWHQ
jgi:hypothetical protein